MRSWAQDCFLSLLTQGQKLFVLSLLLLCNIKGPLPEPWRQQSLLPLSQWLEAIIHRKGMAGFGRFPQWELTLLQQGLPLQGWCSVVSSLSPLFLISTQWEHGEEAVSGNKLLFCLRLWGIINFHPFPHLAFSNLLTILAEFLAPFMVLDISSTVLTSYLLGGASLSLELRLLAWSVTLARMSNHPNLCGTEEFPKTWDLQD